MRQLIVLGIVLLGIVFPSRGASLYPARLDDPSAVYLSQDQFPVRADGNADDSAAIQAAIDRVQETTGEGILFIPAGRYRVTRTIYVWPGVRVIGYGDQRPVFVLADKTPGFQEGIGYMFFFAGSRPNRRAGGATFAGRAFRPLPTPPGTVPPIQTIADANPGTFYSAMTHIDFEIGSDNAAAVGIRFHVAQQGYLAHMDLQMWSRLAPLHDIGDGAEHRHFHGRREWMS